MTNTYSVPMGGLPAQTQLMTGRAVFTSSYAVIPRGVMRDIVTSQLPHWTHARAWILARPLSGFAETFSYFLMEVEPGGGSDAPEPDAGAEGVIFVVAGELTLETNGKTQVLPVGGYGYLAPGSKWCAHNRGKVPAVFHWVRKAYESSEGVAVPESFVTHEADVKPVAMPDTKGAWSTTRFVDPADMRYDMHVNIVAFEPGGVIPFEETHVMEHGIFVLEGKAVYKLNTDWVEVEAGDFLWLRAFCPQACYASGPGKFRYLLYKDVNRFPRLKL